MLLKNKRKALAELLYFDNWPLLVMHRLFFRRHPLVVYRKNGLDFVIDYEGGDHCGIRACIVTDMYRRYFSALPQRPLRVLDIGANGGGFALSLALAGFSLEKVVCVEMHPATFTRLRFNMERNLSGKAICLNAAAYSADGYLDVPLGGAGSTGYSLHTLSKGHSVAQIETVTFDTLTTRYFVETPIDICKIDIEGAEFELLLTGAAQHLSDCRFLVIEIHPHPQYLRQDLTRFLVQHGFVSAEMNNTAQDVLLFSNNKLVNSRLSD